MPTSPQAPSQSVSKQNPDDLISIVWESAISSLITTFMVLVMGSVALDIVGGLTEDMIPSAPPGLSHLDDTRLSAAWNSIESAFVSHRFGVVFAIVFVLTCRKKLAGMAEDDASDPASETTAATVLAAKKSRLKRAAWRLSDNWFGLIVSNAFTALMAAIVLSVLSNFSLTALLWHFLASVLLAPLRAVAGHIIGGSASGTAQRWIDWYGHNALKFNFWLLYAGAICDDLGLPNFKTLSRFFWRRWKRRAGLAAS